MGYLQLDLTSFTKNLMQYKDIIIGQYSY